MRGKMCQVVKCHFSCLHIFHFLFLATPEILDSTSFFQNCQALSHLKSFGPDILFLQSTHYTHPSPQCFPHMPALPRHTQVTTCSHTCFRSILDISQSLQKIPRHLFLLFTILIPCPLSSQNLSLYLIFFNTCTCIYLFYVWLLYDQRKQKISLFCFSHHDQ